MKANEAPEKIYIPSDLDWKTETCIAHRREKDDIEYTRIDAFIEKAEKFFEDNLTEEDWEYRCIELTEVKTNYVSKDSFIRAFRNYMKKE